ncbi:MAG: hypothetical protein ACREPT_04875 [Rudaea sp.]
MHIVTRVIAFTRSYQLARQFAFIERSIQSLSLPSRLKLDLLAKNEISRSEKCEFPHLYGTPPDRRYVAWGQGSETGYFRAHSENVEVRLVGIALWLAVVLHETRDSPQPGLLQQHRNVLRMLRELHELKQPTPRGSRDRLLAGNAA